LLNSLPSVPEITREPRDVFLDEVGLSLSVTHPGSSSPALPPSKNFLAKSLDITSFSGPAEPFLSVLV
jgi:hypothetical protein